MTQRNRFPIRRAAKRLPGFFAPAALLALTPGLAARADVSNYVGSRRQIRACVLVSSASSVKPAVNSPAPYIPVNPAPYVFHALNQRADLKPAGYIFVNPLAPASITQDIYNRWRTRDTGNNDPAFLNNRTQSQAFQVGAPLTRNIGGYWEVDLDRVSAEQLKNFDVVYLPLRTGRFYPGSVQPPTQVVFTSEEREKLRQFADSGGTIWAEDEGTTTTPTNFIVGLKSVAQPNADRNRAFIVNSNHPIVNYPYRILPYEARGIGRDGRSGTNLFSDQAGSNPVAPNIVTPIVSGPSGISLYAGDFGGGHLVVTSRHVGGNLSRFLGGGPRSYSVTGAYFNDGAVSGDLNGREYPNAIPRLDAEIFYNAVAWASSVPTAGANSRRTASTQDTLGSQLGTKFAVFPTTPLLPGATTYNPGSGAVTHKGLVFAVDGTNTLHAYDASPTQDLDGNRNTDDGIPDLIYGTSYDEVWKLALGGGGANYNLSTPTVVSVYDASKSAPSDSIWLTRTDGTTFGLNAFPATNGVFTQPAGPDFTLVNQQGNSNFNAPGFQASAPNNRKMPSLAPAPVFSEGVLFALEYVQGNNIQPGMGWRIFPIDVLRSIREGGAAPKNVFPAAGYGGSAEPNAVMPPVNVGSTGANTAPLPGMSQPAGPLAVGYVANTLSSGIDRVVYVSQRSLPAAVGNPTTDPDTVRGFWFSTKGESLLAITPGTTYIPHGDRARAPWWTPRNGAAAPVYAVNLAPAIHAVQRDASGNVINTLEYVYKTFNSNLKFDVTYEKRDANDPNSPRVMNVVLLKALPNGGNGWTVTADYTLNWSADAISGSAAPTSDELDFALLHRRQFQLYKPALPLVGVDQTTHHLTGGVVVSGQDNVVFNSTGLIAGSTELPDRVYSVQDNFANTETLSPAQNNSGIATTGTAGVDVKWMFSPVIPGSYTIGNTSISYQARLQTTNVLTNSAISLYDFKAVGSPAISNGVVYVVGVASDSPSAATTAPANGRLYTVVLALRANVDATFSIGQAIDQPMAGQSSTPVTIRQPNLTKGGAQNGSDALSLTFDPNRPASQNDITVEPESGIIHIRNFRSASNDQDALNLALPFYVYIGDPNSTTPIEIKNKQTGFGILDNLLWFAAIPSGPLTAANDPSGSPIGFGQGLNYMLPTSGPSVFGNTLTFASHSIYPANDPDFKPGTFGSAHVNRIVNLDVAGLANAKGALYSGSSSNREVYAFASEVLTDPADGKPFRNAYPIVNPPLASLNTLAVATPNGLAALDNQIALIADRNRLIEVDAGGNPFWTLDATRTQTVAGGTLDDTGTPTSITVPLSRPATATRSAVNEFLIADSGNNRIVQVTRSGQVRNEVTQFFNGLNFLTQGDPLTLSRPSDVQTYTDTYGPGSTLSIVNRDTGVTYSYTGPYFAVHYIIADSGNQRVIEVVDITDFEGDPVQMTASNGSANVSMYHQVIFVTRSLKEQNARFNYRTVYQYRDKDGTTGNYADFLIATVDNSTQPNLENGSAAFGQNNNSATGPGGSLVKIRRYDYTTPTDGNVYAVFNSISITDKTGKIVRRQNISNPTWCRPFFVADPTNPANGLTRYLLADANGCYVLHEQGAELVVEWMLSSDDYLQLTGRPLRAACIQRLTQSDPYTDANGTVRLAPHYLITNTYSGRDSIPKVFSVTATGDIKGEVFEVRGVDYYASTDTNTNEYNGYLTVSATRNPRLYTANAGGLTRNPGSAIVRLIPNETFAGNVIKRSIGKPGQATSRLDQPSFATGPF